MRLNQSHLRGRDEFLRIVGGFLIEDSTLVDLRTGLAQSRLRQARELSVLLRWKRILVFGGLEALPHIRIGSPDESDLLKQTTKLKAVCRATWNSSTVTGNIISLLARIFL